jgi:hypothetical protein
MERKDVAYLINTTPKYFYLLPLHVSLIRRYAPDCRWDIWVATEEPGHPIFKNLGVKVLPLPKEESGFLASRAAALRLLPSFYTYVLPMQEDFLLEQPAMQGALDEALKIFDFDPKVQSIRLMPCPGPVENIHYSFEWESWWTKENWKVLGPSDEYMFCFQATLWRRGAIQTWYTQLCKQFALDYPQATEEEKRTLEIRANYAENSRGQEYFRKWMKGLHIAWARMGTQPNAVYLSPWPYRPTAVVGGVLQPWAITFAKREGFELQPNN